MMASGDVDGREMLRRQPVSGVGGLLGLGMPLGGMGTEGEDGEQRCHGFGAEDQSTF